MLIRIGILFWWCGLGVAALILYLIGAAALDHAHCPAIYAAQAKAEAKYAADYTKFKREHPEATDISFALSAASNKLGSEDYTQKIKTCEQYAGPWEPLAAAVIFVCIFWSFAFLFGGSFWRPPIIRRQRQ